MRAYFLWIININLEDHFMKTTFSLLLILSLSVMWLYGQGINDDVYFRPSDANNVQGQTNIKPERTVRPRQKEGAKEIIYLDSRNSSNVIITEDSIVVHSAQSRGQASDTIYNEETGYYLNGFTGSEMEFEYAERIRRFHNPRFTIHISDPQFMDIHFLDNNDWNVYVDGAYAWVTPTWTNPFWWNYHWMPHSYSSWHWRTWHSPWRGRHMGWFGPWSPWHHGMYAGHWGWPHFGGHWGWPHFGGYWGGSFGFYGSYSWGFPGYFHHPWYHPWGGGVEVTRRKTYYSENARRNQSGISGMSSPAINRIGGASAQRTNAIYSQHESRINQPTRRNTNIANSNDQTVTRATSILRNTRVTEGSAHSINTRTRTGVNVPNRNNPLVQGSVRESERINNRSVVGGEAVRRSVSPATSTSQSSERNATVNRNTTVRAGSGRAPVRNQSESRSTNSSTVNQSSGRSNWSSPSNFSNSSNSSSSSGSSVRSSAPSFSSPSSSPGGSSSGGARNSGGGSSSGGRR